MAKGFKIPKAVRDKMPKQNFDLPAGPTLFIRQFRYSIQGGHTVIGFGEGDVFHTKIMMDNDLALNLAQQIRQSFIVPAEVPANDVVVETPVGKVPKAGTGA